MAGYTAPQVQRHIVLNAQFARDIIRKNKRNKVNTRDFSRTMIELFEATSDNYDWNIFAGDILWTEKNANKRVKFDLTSQSQQPWVLAAVNGMPMSISEFNKMPGLTHRDKVRNAFMSKAQVVGVSLKTQIYEGENVPSNDDPVALMAGVTGMPNLGPFNIKPLDWVCWDIPFYGKPMERDKTNVKGHTDTCRKLITVPLSEAYTLSVDTVKNFIEDSWRVNGNVNIATLEDHFNRIYGAMNAAALNIADKEVIIFGIMAQPGGVDNAFLLLDKGPVCDEKELFSHFCDVDYELEKGAQALLLRVVPAILGDDHWLKTLKTVINAVALVRDAGAQEAFQKLLNMMKWQQMKVRERIIGRALRGAISGERFDILLG
jgi:hypothetical protein